MRCHDARMTVDEEAPVPGTARGSVDGRDPLADRLTRLARVTTSLARATDVGSVAEVVVGPGGRSGRRRASPG